MEGKLIADPASPGCYIVSTLIEESDAPDELAVFYGSNALDRAILFAAKSGYYDKWHDPQGLSEPVK